MWVLKTVLLKQDYSETCVLRPPYGTTKSGLILQVVFYQRYKFIEMQVYVPTKMVLYDRWSLITAVLKHRFHCTHFDISPCYMMLHDMTWYYMAWHDVTWHDMTWCYITWHDAAWHDMLHDMTCCYMTWHDVTWHDMLHDMMVHDMTWYYMTWHDVTWHDMMVHDMIHKLKFFDEWLLNAIILQFL